MALSESSIKGMAAPRKGRRIVSDNHRDAPRGFALRITSNGTKSFVLRYQTQGKQRLLTIGEWPTWSLAAARKKATEIRHQVDSGVDVLEQRRAKPERETVKGIAQQWFVKRVDQLSSGHRVRAMLEKYLLPDFGSREIKGVRRAEIISLIDHIAAKHPRQASLLLGHIKRLWAFAEDMEFIEASPVATIKPSRISKKLTPKARGRVLSDEEIAAFFNNCQNTGVHKLVQLALQLVLVTGQRPGEVAGMMWQEINQQQWTIPATRRGKTATEHVVFLSDLALEILQQAKSEVKRLNKRHPRQGAYVFEMANGKPLTNATLSHAVRKHAEGLGSVEDSTWGHWRPHDLRRTMRTGLARLGVPETIAEAAIGHTRTGIVGVYDRHRYLAETRQALATWATHIEKLIC